MRLLAPAKLTLSLKIMSRRSDGMHLIESEMISVSLFDELVLAVGDDDGDSSKLTVVDSLDLDRIGFGISSVPRGPENLVTRASELMGLRHKVTLYKRIPPGAGLGGGSSDAGAIVRYAATDFIHDNVASLGADVPFCVQVDRANVSGIGDVVEPMETFRRTFVLFLIPIHSPTPKVYSMFDEISKDANNESSDFQRNDLEIAALAVSPRLVQYRRMLTRRFNITPRLAGSGSTYFIESSFAVLGLERSGGGIIVLHCDGLNFVAVEVEELSYKDLTHAQDKINRRF